MKRQKLNYRFHNPNTAETTADYILQIFIEANRKKIEQAMQNAAAIQLASLPCPASEISPAKKIRSA